MACTGIDQQASASKKCRAKDGSRVQAPDPDRAGSQHFIANTKVQVADWAQLASLSLSQALAVDSTFTSNELRILSKAQPLRASSAEGAVDSDRHPQDSQHAGLQVDSPLHSSVL